MKAQVNAQELRNAVGWISKVVNQRSVLPILKGVMLFTNGNSIGVKATNLTTTATRYVEAEIEPHREDWGLVLDAKILKAYLGKVGKSKDATLTIEDDTFVSSLGTMRFQSMDKEDYPIVKGAEYNVAWPIDLDELPLKKLLAFTASDDTSRPVLACLFVEHGQGKTRYAGADGFRLVTYGDEVEEPEHEWLVCRDTIKLVADLKGKCVVSFGPNQVKFATNGSIVEGHLTEGKFPDYWQIIPSDDRGFWATFDTKEFNDALEMLSPITRDKANLTVLTFYEHGLATLTDSDEQCEAMIHWEGNREPDIHSETFEIAFASDLMLSCLALCDDEARIMFQEPSKSMKVAGQGATMVLMPMHIQR